MPLPSQSRGTFIIHQDEPTTVVATSTGIPRSVSRSQIPLAARTRSQTRLSSFVSENKLAKIDRRLGSTIGKEQTKGKVDSVRRPLGEQMMNIQRGLVVDGKKDGLKRKMEIDNKVVKRPRIGQAQHLRQVGTMNRLLEPKTPPKMEREHKQVVQPTPARDILAANPLNVGMDVDSDSDSSPEANSHFIARPPTPPRPHLHLDASASERQVVKTPSPGGIDVDSPDRRPGASVKQTTTPTKTPTRQSSLVARPPITPRSTIPTPRRAMGSISKFRAGPSSVRKPAWSPIKPIDEALPILQSLMAEGIPREPHTVSEGDDTVSLMAIKPDDVLREESLSIVDMGESAMELSTESRIPPEFYTTSVSTDPTPMPAKSEPHSGPAPISKQVVIEPAPSRLPRPISMAPLQTSTAVLPGIGQQKKSSIPVLSKSAASAMTLGRGLPRSAPGLSLSTEEAATSAPVRRKPSYPSSLGSGPLARPRDRMVSGPTLYRQQDGTLGPLKEEPAGPKGRQSPRSVSEPVPRPRPSLASSTSRREGLSSETSKSIAGLSDALNKLKMKRPENSSDPDRAKASIGRLGLGLPSRPSVNMPPPPAIEAPVSNPTLVTSSRLSSVHRPRHSILPMAASPDTSTSSEEDQVDAGDRSLAAIMCSTSGGGCFKGVVAFIDVKTSDGEDAGPIFTAMIKALGGRVLSRLTENVTHIIYKSGKPTTLAWYRKQEEDERPHIVGISWVTRSKEKGERLGETPFVVDVAQEDIFQKRRKSMEPKALMQSTLERSSLHDTNLNIASIRRQSMMYAPKISSPLKKTFRSMDHDEY